MTGIVIRFAKKAVVRSGGMCDAKSSPMKAFKFACPVCGQHLNADADTTGSQIECPTCFQKILVPQAPATADGKFILSASQVRKPRPTGVAEITAPVIRSSRVPWKLAVMMGLLLCIAASAFVFRGTIFNANKSKPEMSDDGGDSHNGGSSIVADKSMTLPSSEWDKHWQLDLTSVSFADIPAQGRVHRVEFTCDRAYLQNGILTLRQGMGRPADLSISIALRQPATQWIGNTVLIAPATSRAPQVTLQWKTDAKNSLTQSFLTGYAMKLEVGKAINGKAPAKIYLCTPDDAKSVVVGTFTIEIRRPRTQQP